MTATVEKLNGNERAQDFQQWVTAQMQERKITEDELKAILADFGVDVPSKVRPKDRGSIKTLIEAEVEAKQMAKERREDWMWDRLEAIQWTVERPAKLFPDNTYTEVNPEGLKECWKLMVESRENDPDENNGILRECLWRNLDELPPTRKGNEIRFEAVLDLLKVAQYDALEEAWDLLTLLTERDPLLPRIWAAIDSSPSHDWSCLETRYDALRWRLSTDDVNEDCYRELLRIADHAGKFGHHNLQRTVTAVSVIHENMLRDKKALQAAVDVPQCGRRTYEHRKLNLE